MELALPLTEYSKFLIAMIAIVNPLMILPIYVRITGGLSRTENKRLARQVAFASTTALVISLFLGEDILRFFGISLPSFRIAGGLLLIVMGMQLIYENSTSERTTDTGPLPNTQLVVPIAIPLLAGPGAFSTVIVFSFRGSSWEHYGLMMLCLMLIGSIIWLSLRTGGKLLRRVGPTAVAISNKVMGLIIVAIAVEFIAVGIRQFVTA